MVEIHEAAAKLWADKLRDGFSIDTGDVELSKEISKMAAENRQVTNVEIDAFEQRLSEAIAQHLVSKNELFLTVDYEPEGLLKKAFGQSDIGQLPIKSRMWVYRDYLVYGFGYSSKLTEWHLPQ